MREGREKLATVGRAESNGAGGSQGMSKGGVG